MLSTAQALQEWDRVLKLLVDFKVYAAANPDDLSIPLPLQNRLESSSIVLDSELASPLATWKQLLQKKVPRQVLSACCELMTMRNVTTRTSGQVLAMLLVTRASADLSPLAAVTTTSSSSNSGGVSDSSKLTAMLWAQFEESGLVEQLHKALSSQASQLGFDQLGRSAHILESPLDLSNQLKLFLGLQHMHPSFFTSHAAGRQCIVPAMQLGLASLQYISRVLELAGRQQWMERVLIVTKCAACRAACAAATMLEGVLGLPSDGQGAASSSSGGSSANTATEAAVAVLHSPQTAQWVCMEVLLMMLSHFTRDPMATNSPSCGVPSNSSSSTSNTSTINTSSSNSSVVAGNSSPAITTSSSRAATHSNQQPTLNGTENMQQHPPSSSASGESWLPAALAPSMPAAYISMLEQLGCSREVGLWLATLTEQCHPAQRGHAAIDTSASHEPDAAAMLARLQMYALLLQGLICHGTCHPALSALHLTTSAAMLQWLSSTPAGRLSTMREPDCEGMCSVAYMACQHGRMLAEQLTGSLMRIDQNQASCVAMGWAQAVAADQANVQLSAVVLKQLLAECHGLLISGELRIDSSSSISSCSSSDNIAVALARGGGTAGSILLQSCNGVVHMLAGPISVAGTARGISGLEPEMGPAASSLAQLHVDHAELCKLLQDYVRTVAAAATAAATAGPSSSMEQHTTRVMECVAALFGVVSYWRNAASPLLTKGPLIAPLAVAGGANGPPALQLFGLLCSLLKVCSSNSRVVLPATVMCAIGSLVDTALNCFEQWSTWRWSCQQCCQQVHMC